MSQQVFSNNYLDNPVIWFEIEKKKKSCRMGMLEESKPNKWNIRIWEYKDYEFLGVRRN